MRIRTASIRSFGGLRDRSYCFSDGLTVLQGPNESGKTTVMEFIRSTLVPSSKRNQYPSRERTDSGTLTYEQDGEERTLRLVQKTVEGDCPDMPTGTDDPALYRSVFAMTPSDLDDEKVVTEGGVKSRFLTVPGGDVLPAARSSAESLWESSLGRRSNSRSRVLSLDSEISDLDASIAESRGQVDGYGDLDRRRSELREELERLAGESEADAETKRIHAIYESNRSNYDRLSELQKERAGLGEFVTVSPEDEARYGELVSRASAAESELAQLNGRRQEEERDLRGADRRKVAARSKAIETFPGRLQAYREDSRALRELESRQRVPKRSAPVTEVRRVRSVPVMALGLILAAAGLVLGAMLTPYAVALTAVGAVAVVMGALGREVRVQTAPPEVDDGTDAEIEAVRRRMSAFEDDVASVMSDLGLESYGMEDDVECLTKARDAAASIERMERHVLRARADKGDADTKLLQFTQRFSGKEGFQRSLESTRRAAEIDRRIAELRGAISSAGLDPDVPVCPVERPTGDSSVRIGDVRQEIGSIEERMRSILDTEDLERMMDRREQLSTELGRALDDGAVGLLACSIADDACEEIYSQVQPGVIATADRFLSMMTGGRYRLDTDPRSKDLSIRSGDEVKGIGEWSSGLRAQVLLSVKLAVAREMGEGRVPVILDDVLLPFDSGRKEGALRALAALAEEMQILLFTCDAETCAIAETIDGITVRDM